jgi:rod shape-determining protein MreC
VVAAVVLSLGLMVVDHRYHHLEALRAALAFVTYPLQAVAELPITSTRWLRGTLATREQLQQDNARLHEENLKLLARLQKYEALRAENLRLRDLLESSFKVGDRVLVAELSAVDLDPYRQQVVIDKGSTSGVFEGQPVLDAHAVMGQVIHVTPYNATVLLITDASHAMPVQVLRNGLRTIAVGTGRINQLELPYLPNDADIREDDLLVTSGLGGKFPPGYPVARVARVDRTPDQPFAQVLAEPRAHLDRSREVLLVWTMDPPPRPDAAAAAAPEEPSP